MSRLLHPYPLLFEAGDRLSRDEFLRRWEQMPELKHAELIDGVVYLPSPVSIEHSQFQGTFALVLHVYKLKTPGCDVLPQATWLMAQKSAPQPDLALHILAEYGGQFRLTRSLATGAPELAVEIVRSTRSYDLGPKLALYLRSDVQDYVAALIEEQRIEWRVLEQGSYRLISPNPDGIFQSRVFPGLWVDQTAFWMRDENRLLEVLEAGLRSEEHARFVDMLSRRRG